MRWIFLACAVVAMTGLGALGAPAHATAADDMMAADRAFAAMSIEKGTRAAFLTYMADDVRLFDGEHPPIIGKAAVMDYYAKNPESPGARLEWTPVEADASPDGVLGYTRGTWVFTAKKKDGTEARVTGYYVTMWKKQDDGAYKFTLDIGGVDPEPTAD